MFLLCFGSTFEITVTYTNSMYNLTLKNTSFVIVLKLCIQIQIEKKNFSLCASFRDNCAFDIDWHKVCKSIRCLTMSND